MAWTPPKTWSDTRDRLNAANLNTYMRDNQLALRADQAALGQRVTALEDGGLSDPEVRAINVSNLGGANRVRLTNLTPPTGTKVFFLSFRIERGGRWVAAAPVSYAIWSAYSEVAEGVDVVSDNRWGWATESGDSTHQMSGFVARGTGGVLAFGLVSLPGNAAIRFDRVMVMWYV